MKIQIQRPSVATQVFLVDSDLLKPGDIFGHEGMEYIIQDLPIRDGGSFRYTACCMQAARRTGDILDKLRSMNFSEDGSHL